MPAETGQYELQAAYIRGYPEAEMAVIMFLVDTFIRPSKSQFPLVLLALTLKNETGGVPGKSHALNVL